jgi:hypothetical protein
VALIIYPHLAPKLKKEYSYSTSTPSLGFGDRLHGEVYILLGHRSALNITAVQISTGMAGWEGGVQNGPWVLGTLIYEVKLQRKKILEGYLPPCTPKLHQYDYPK